MSQFVTLLHATLSRSRIIILLAVVPSMTAECGNGWNRPACRWSFTHFTFARPPAC